MSFNGNQIREFINGVTLNFAGYLQDEFVRLYANDNWLKTKVDLLIASAATFEVGDSYIKGKRQARSAVHPWIYWHEPDAVISDANAPDWVTYARAKKHEWTDPSTGIEYSNLVGSNWAVSSNVATLTFTNTTKNNEMLAGLSENFLKFGGTWADFAMVLNVPAVGNIAAGDKVVTGLTLSTNQITFPETASDGSGAATFDAEIYPHRIAGSSTTAKWRQRKGVPYSPGDGIVAGAGHRDRIEDHDHSDGLQENAIYGGGALNAMSFQAITRLTSGVLNARTGNTTRATGEGVFIADYLGVWAP